MQQLLTIAQPDSSTKHAKMLKACLAGCQKKASPNLTLCMSLFVRWMETMVTNNLDSSLYRISQQRLCGRNPTHALVNGSPCDDELGCPLRYSSQQKCTKIAQPKMHQFADREALGRRLWAVPKADASRKCSVTSEQIKSRCRKPIARQTSPPQRSVLLKPWRFAYEP